MYWLPRLAWKLFTNIPNYQKELIVEYLKLQACLNRIQTNGWTMFTDLLSVQIEWVYSQYVNTGFEMFAYIIWTILRVSFFKLLIHSWWPIETKILPHCCFFFIFIFLIFLVCHISQFCWACWVSSTLGKKY